MKSLMSLWSRVADDLATWCCTSAARDCKTVESRFEHEGESFFTITLSQFGKDFERSLDQGCVSRQDFQGYKWRSGLPVFLQGFLGQVFEPSSGRLLDEPNIAAIQAVRQLTLLYSKMFKVSNKRRERAAMTMYIECENEVKIFDAHFEPEARDDFRRVSNIVLGRVLMDVDREIGSPWDLRPTHGPGATADGLKGNRKWSQLTWTRRLEEYFSATDFLLPSPSYYDELRDVDFIEPEAEVPVKVLSVPKTQKTPRIIAAEPTVMMFMQQAIRRVMYKKVERDNLLNAFIGFQDQEPNQHLAEVGSREGTLATLDLSEASDRVSFEHVRELLAFTPDLFQAVSACRSLKAQVPGHGIIPLSKFASMGSALSFPIEAMVFLSIVFIGIEKDLNRPLTRRDVKSYRGKVRVFGDDIIVPVEHVRSVIGALESFGMRVNRNKSFWTGKFRESCGKEFYDGHDVSIVKVRQSFPSSRRDATEVVSWVSTTNQFFMAGLWGTTRWLDSLLGKILRDYPVVASTSSVLGRHSFMGYFTQKMCDRFHSPLVKGFVVRGVPPKDPLGEHFALRKWFLLRGDLPIADEDHLERSGRPLVVSIKRVWAQPF